MKDENLSGSEANGTNRIHAGVDECKIASPQESVDVMAARERVNEIIRARRRNFYVDALEVTGRLRVFAGALADSLGEVTVDEAINALQKDAHRLLEDLRHGIRIKL